LEAILFSAVSPAERAFQEETAEWLEERSHWDRRRSWAALEGTASRPQPGPDAIAEPAA
jgi:hypothetical protein